MRPRWIILVITIIVLMGAGIFLRSWYPGYRDWHRTAGPVFGEIEPSDGATVYASDVWIRWSSPVLTKGRVLWRKARGFRVDSADAGNGEQLLAHLGLLNAGSKYEYIVEQSDGNLMLRSAVRTLTVKSGLTFEPVIDQTVERDYDQSVKLRLRNRGSQPVTVAAKALRQFDDLPANMTGFGSEDVPGQIAPHSTLDLRLAVTAADATHDSYEIPIEAGGAYIIARFHVHLPKLNLAFRVTGDDPNTLAKTVEIQNNGDPVTDLAVHAAPTNQLDLELQPAVNHAPLNAGSSMRLTVSPILYLEFESLKAEIEASAAGQTTRFAVEFQAPPGKRLIGVRSDETTSSRASDIYCTNHPNTCSNLPGPPGSGAASSVSGGLGPVATVDSNMGIRIAKASEKYDGKPYKSDTDGPDTFDCSGLVARAYMDNGLPDPRYFPEEGHGCEKMWNHQQRIPKDDTPRVGDVAIFDINHKNDKNGVSVPDHCAIVIGVEDGKVTIRQAIGGGVVVSDLDHHACKAGGKTCRDYLMGYVRGLALPAPTPMPTPVPNTCPLPPLPGGCNFY